ncbi:MAG TPA: hypothetical protein VND94_11150 [Terriglobia bacterium]|nr:hypothetical protein [Terriglobia bacterium]
MFRSKRLSLAAIAATIVFYGSSADASSILVDQGNVTYDPDTRLQWLDISETRGLSYNQVLNNSGVDFVKNGWRFATDFEVDQLYRHAGLPLASYPNGTFFYHSDPSQPGYAALEHDAFVLGSELGWVTPSSAPDYFTAAIFDIHQTPRNQATLGYSFLSLLGYLESGPNSSITVDEYLDTINKDQQIRVVGSLLVRDVSAVPIPGEAIPFGALLLGLTGINLWRRRQLGLSRL